MVAASEAAPSLDVYEDYFRDTVWWSSLVYAVFREKSWSDYQYCLAVLAEKSRPRRIVVLVDVEESIPHRYTLKLLQKTQKDVPRNSVARKIMDFFNEKTFVTEELPWYSKDLLEHAGMYDKIDSRSSPDVLCVVTLLIPTHLSMGMNV